MEIYLHTTLVDVVGREDIQYNKPTDGMAISTDIIDFDYLHTASEAYVRLLANFVVNSQWLDTDETK